MALRGYLFITAAAALWGVVGPFSRLAFQQGVAPLEAAFWRAIIAWACFAVHALVRREVRIQRRDIGPLLGFAVTGVTLFYGSYQIAIQKGGAALAVVLLYTAPVWVAVLSRVFFREAMSALKLMALMLTLEGVAVVSLGAGDVDLGIRGGNPLIAVPAGLVAGFCYALYYIFGKYFSGRYTSPNLFVYMLPAGALGLLPWLSFTAKTPLAWLALGWVARYQRGGTPPHGCVVAWLLEPAPRDIPPWPSGESRLSPSLTVPGRLGLPPLLERHFLDCINVILSLEAPSPALARDQSVPFPAAILLFLGTPDATRTAPGTI